MVRCVDAGLAAVIFTVPLLMGGRVALGQFVLVALALWVAVCWCLRQCLATRGQWIRSPAGPLLAAALALVGLQLVPLPPAVLNAISPHLYESLPLWTPETDAPATLGVWTTLSLTPDATRTGFVVLAAFGLLLLSTVQRVRRVDDAERLLRWIALSTVAMAGFALVQHLLGNGKYFWFFEPPFQHAHANIRSVVTGSFTNRNHFAQFIALGIGPLIWWIYSGSQQGNDREPTRPDAFGRNSPRRDLKPGLRCVALAVCGFAGLMSLSRGGAIAMLAAATVCTLILYRGSFISRKSLLALIGAAAFLGAGLCIYGYELVAARVDDFKSLGKLDSKQTRQRLWQASAQGVADYPLAGTGLGSHCEVYPLYFQDGPESSGDLEFTHAESGYAQVPLETGIPGLLLVLVAVGLCVYWCLGAVGRGVSGRVRLCLAAIAASLAASFLHSAFDFVWYVPGCMIAVVISAACACRLWQMTRDQNGRPAAAVRIPRAGWAVATACLVLVGSFLLRHTLAAVMAEPAWNRYLRMSMARSLPEGLSSHDRLESMARELATVLRWRPDHARAHSRMASVQLRLFDHPKHVPVCPMGLVQVREAALASEFESSDALHDWLSRAFGRRWEHLTVALQHVRQAAALCPLQGEVYLYLAELSFLEGPRSPGKAVYTNQALKVRPFDGAVLFAAGQEAVLEGDLNLALKYWQASFAAGAAHQDRLIRALGGQVPVDFFLKTFQPNLATLKRMAAHYRQLDRPDELRLLWRHYARRTEQVARDLQGNEAAGLWVEAAGAHRAIDDLPQCIRCLRRAVRCDCLHYGARRALGIYLCDSKEYAEARQHLRWCLQRRPQDEQIRRKLEAAVDKQLRLAARATTAE